jgi:competence protein ComGC
MIRIFFRRKQMKMLKDKRGITLVALVITIIVLLILAGITINLTIGEDGIITKAKEAGSKMEMASIKEKLELEKLNLLFESEENVSTLDTYINQLIEKGIISSSDIENTEYDNSKLITSDGCVFLITEENGDVQIEYKGKVGEVIIVDRTKPVLTIKKVEANYIEIEGTDNSSGIVGYVVSKTENIPETFVECENTLNFNIKIDGLDENTTYYIWIKDAEGNVSECKIATTSIINYTLQTGAKYATLQNALENATSGETISVISDYTDTSDVVVNKNVKLNTNGKTLIRTKTIEIADGATLEITGTGTLTTADKIDLLTNKGTLNITHTGEISNTNTGNARVIYNTGTLNVTSAVKISSYGTYATISSGTINISNGTFVSDKKQCIYTATALTISNNPTITGKTDGISLGENATGNINGGTINGLTYSGVNLVGKSSLVVTAGNLTGVTSGIYSNSSKTVTVNNGIINGGNNGIAMAGTGWLIVNDATITGGDQGIFLAENSSATVNISGGTINGKYGLHTYKATGDVTISGGTFHGSLFGLAVSKATTVITITGGTFIGDDYCGIGIYGDATVYLGDATKTVDNDNIILIGEKVCGLYLSKDYSGIVYYNSGTIKGKSGGYGGNYDNIIIRDGYATNTVTSGDYKVTTLVKK